jgi:hypothetical protein
VKHWAAASLRGGREGEREKREEESIQVDRSPQAFKLIADRKPGGLSHRESTHHHDYRVTVADSCRPSLITAPSESESSVDSAIIMMAQGSDGAPEAPRHQRAGRSARPLSHTSAANSPSAPTRKARTRSVKTSESSAPCGTRARSRDARRLPRKQYIYIIYLYI